jgi:hypothetical protein
VLDRISKLISQLFDAKFSLARTKCKDIRRPLSNEELKEMGGAHRGNEKYV